MANNLRVFNTNSEYQSADLVHPAVSYVIETDKVIYEPTPVFKGKWKATYQDSHVESAQCGSSSEIRQFEINKQDLVSVEIGDYCVTSIGNYAFQYCSSLTSVTIPNSVTNIGRWAFYSCRGLTSINIPSGVTSIGETAFGDCTSLSSINIPSGVTSINYQAFSSCSSLTSVTIPNSVTSIGNYAFQYCSSLTSVTIPNSVTNIGSSAFRGCRSLTSIDIPSGVTSIGDRAFDTCNSLTSITVNATTPPTLEWGVFDGSTCSIYVPSQSVQAYKSASGWSEYASRIQPIP